MTNIFTMGVINITPNSFSDGNLYNAEDLLRKKLSSFPRDIIWDIGAESTAPFNDPIGACEEKARLEKVIPLLNEFNPQMISLDSYRGECAQWFFGELQKNGFNQDRFIWNDVSGQWDEEVESFLGHYPNAKYIYSHNLSPSRSKTSAHMDYTEEGLEIITSLKKFFSKNTINPKNIWLDPCFGFSKSHEQNCQLLERMGELFTHFSDFSWLIGISKKSFLRRLLNSTLTHELSKEDSLNKSEWLHLLYIRKMIELHKGSTNNQDLIFRVHDPDLVSAAQFNLSYLK